MDRFGGCGRAWVAPGHPVVSTTGSNNDRRRALERLSGPTAGGDDTMTQFPDLFAALAAPFDAQEVRARTQAGRQLHYITARTAMNRLDSVLGPENWWDEYVPGENSVLCRLTVRLPDGSTLTKADAGGYAGMPDSGRRRQERLLRRLQAGRREVRRRPLPLPRRRPRLRPRARAGRRPGRRSRPEPVAGPGPSRRAPAPRPPGRRTATARPPDRAGPSSPGPRSRSSGTRSAS